MFSFTAVNLSFFKFVSWWLEVFYICSTPSLKTHTRFHINMALIFDEQGFTSLPKGFLILVEAYLNTPWYNIKTDPNDAILREFVSKCHQYNLVFLFIEIVKQNAKTIYYSQNLIMWGHLCHLILANKLMLLSHANAGLITHFPLEADCELS